MTMTDTATTQRKDPNNWSWWLNALKGEVAPIHDGDPQPGFYRVRRKGRDVESACAFWFDSGTGDLRCHMDGQNFDLQRALEIWPYASKKPVTKEAYGERIRDGKWPGDNAAVVGHNAAPVGDDAASIADRIEDLSREAAKLIAAGAAKTEAESDQASDLANTFGELEGKTKDLHKAEKDPHLEAGRVVDRKWFPLRDRAAELKTNLKRVVVTPFLTKKNDEIKKAQTAAVASGVAPDALPQVRTTAGSSKRATGLRTYYRAEITDKAQLLESLKDHPDVVACIQKIADAAASKKLALPGCKVIEEQRAA